MKITYKTLEKDFLDFYLYTTFKSERIKKKRRNSVIIFSVIPLAFAMYFFVDNNTTVAAYFGAITIICALFYPKYFDWRYKKHFQYFIQDNLSDRFNEPAELEINKDSLFSKDVSGEGRIKLSEINEINETQTHFFFQVASGASLIIPKRELDSSEEFKSKLESLGLTISLDI